MPAAPIRQQKRLSVIVAARTPSATLEEVLRSLAAQHRASELDVILADGSPDGSMAMIRHRCLPQARHISLPGGNLPALKAAAIRQAEGDFIAMLDPSDAADPDWADQIIEGFADPGVTAVGGVVLQAGSGSAGNVSAYLFEYGAFNPPVTPGDTQGDLPGNNVAYRRAALTDTCADILAAEGFNKPFVHERIRAAGGRLVIRPSMRVRHLTNYPFIAFGVRRFHYGRCFGATRVRRASRGKKWLFRLFAPAVPPLLMSRHLRRAWQHPANRRLLPRAALALCGVCAFWGMGEWLGYWFGPGHSCQELY
ncbi:glycosyltransferase [Gemmatimonas groenlandica]|uniref:Glycosyltransferase n=1 Tax=Gemmatimonas groenlandica TaxID=2732249 RepID=A0A6M4IIT5_9BACT|nr:glycosyltransferase [Gemmatimonas groenlandica]QJR34540.1 glycosyltransferase [Gemmatimonas groenlandica]